MTLGQHVNLIKLSVGTQTVDGLMEWQAERRAERRDPFNRHVTRMWPKRESEVLLGGSIYWVIQGVIQCRQRIERFDEVIGEDGIRRCGIILDADLIRTAPAPKRPFQGWRYLNASDAPPDLSHGRSGDDVLPPSLSAALSDIGIL